MATPVSSINKTDCHNIAEILLRVALNTIEYQTNHHLKGLEDNFEVVQEHLHLASIFYFFAFFYFSSVLSYDPNMS